MNESLDRQTTPLRCSCGCTFARLRADGAVVIVSRHHGKNCINVLTLDDLLTLRKDVDVKQYQSIQSLFPEGDS